MYGDTEYCLSYTVFVSEVQPGAVVTRSKCIANLHTTLHWQQQNTIVLFHNIFFSSGEQPEQRIAAHKF